MTKTTATLILTLSALGLSAAPSFAESESGHDVKRVERVMVNKMQPTHVGFSSAINVQPEPKVLDSNNPNVGELSADLKTDGQSFGWIDETGTPLQMTRTGDEILIRRENGPVSRVKITDYAGIIEPSLAASAVAMAD